MSTLRTATRALLVVGLLGIGTCATALAARPAVAHPVWLSIYVEGGSSNPGSVTNDYNTNTCARSACYYHVISGTAVNLTAAPKGSESFLGWKVNGLLKSCSSTLTVTPKSAMVVDALFGNHPRPCPLGKVALSIYISSHGSKTWGTVTADFDNLSCSKSFCQYRVPAGQAITLTENAANAKAMPFLEWTLNDSFATSDSTLSVTMNKSKVVHAVYHL